MKLISILLFLSFCHISTFSQEVKYSAEQSNRFAFAIYKQFAEENSKNIFYSPFSLSIAMGMTYAGADGATKEQIADVFFFPLEDKLLHKELGGIQSEITKGSSEGIDFSIANQLWADKQYKFKCSYLRMVKRAYRAPVKRMPFRTEPDKCRVDINRWVEEKTNNRIVDLLPDGSISDLTALVLTNAIYFKGKWANKFEEEFTKESPFKTLDGKKVLVNMMNIKSKFNIYQGDELKMLELPYMGNEFSMMVILPDDGISLTEIEKKISIEKLNRYIELMVETDVQVSLPKFKFEAEYALKPVLSKMGMPEPFSLSANFSKMSGNQELKIDEVFHKAFIEVSEEGTEAAAATAVVISRKSITIPVEFIANRPFFFLIKENQSGTIIFMGRVTNPNS